MTYPEKSEIYPHGESLLGGWGGGEGLGGNEGSWGALWEGGLQRIALYEIMINRMILVITLYCKNAECP